jgi:hypothetical protein
VAAVEQLPVPEQNAGSVCVDPAHDPEAHIVALDACWHAPVPVQRPVLPQGGAAVQRPCGSATFAPTLAHEPALAPMLQA